MYDGHRSSIAAFIDRTSNKTFLLLRFLLFPSVFRVFWLLCISVFSRLPLDLDRFPLSCDSMLCLMVPSRLPVFCMLIDCVGQVSFGIQNITSNKKMLELDPEIEINK